MTDENLDASWQNSYNYFYKHSFQFGSQLIFTYGPLAFFYIKAYDPALYAPKLLFTLFLAILSCISLVIIRRYYGLLSATILAIGLVICSGFDSFVFSFQLIILIAYLGKDNTSIRRDVLYLFGIFTILNFLGFIKFTFWVSGLFLVLLLVIKFLVLKDWKRGIATLLSFFVSSIALWLLIGQKVSNYPLYLKYSIEISGAYNEAMSIRGPFSAVLIACFLMIMFVSVFPTHVFKNLKQNINSIVLLISICGFTYLSWKQGFVRQDSHIINFFSFMTFGYGIFFLFLRNEENIGAIRNWIKSRSIFRSLHNDWIVIGTSNKLKMIIVITLMGLSICAFGYSRYSDRFVPMLIKNRIVTIKNVIPFILHPQSLFDYKHALDHSINKTKEKLQLPKIQGIVKNMSVDIYSYNQNYVLYNNFNWKPRPIFQSYSAYSPKLLKLNRDHLYNNGPEYIIYKTQTIDNRFPLLDDSLWFREVLHNYTPIMEEAGFLLFKKKYKVLQLSQLQTVNIYNGKMNEQLDIQNDGKLKYVTLDVKYSILGKIRSILFKPPEVNMAITLANGQERNFRIIPGMAQEPFLLSPLNESNDDIAQTLAGLNVKTVKALRIYSPDAEKYFDPDVSVTLSSDSVNTDFNAEFYQKLMWSDIITRTATKIESEQSLEKIQAYDTSWMLFHPRAAMEFKISPYDTIARAIVSMRQEAKEVGRSDGITFYWEANVDGHWTSLSTLNISPDKFNEKFFDFTADLPKNRNYNVVRLRVDYGPANNSSWDWATIKDINIE